MDVYGIVGNPVGHSVSPPMQTAGFADRGIDATYVTFEPAEDEIKQAIDGAAALGIAGLNVTIPFKQDVFEIVEPDPLAARIGAVNTVAFPDAGQPQGYNTDAAGVTRERLDSADERIYIGGYTFTSKSITEPLLSAVADGVDVRVVLDGAPVGGITRRQATQLDRLVAAGA